MTTGHIIQIAILMTMDLLMGAYFTIEFHRIIARTIKRRRKRHHGYARTRYAAPGRLQHAAQKYNR